MNKILHVILISLFSLTVISCAKKDGSSSSSSSQETDTSGSQSVTLSTSIAFGNAKFGDVKFE